MKNKKMTLWAVSIILVILAIVTYPLLLQEGNPLAILKGIMTLNKNNDLIQISKEPKIYLSKTNKASSPMIKLMEEEGWKCEDQFGSGYIFSKEDTKLIITSRQYTGKYTMWEFEKKTYEKKYKE